MTGTRDKFEKGQTDEFVIETAEIGDLKKIKSVLDNFDLHELILSLNCWIDCHLSFRIGHDNAGLGSAWFLDNVTIDCPSVGKKWLFPCNRWLAKNKDDGSLERELFPEDMDTVEYTPCIKYEVP